MWKKTILTASVAAATAAFLAMAPARAAAVDYDVKLNGVSETYQGQHFPYTGTGTMTIDDTTNTVSYTFALSNGLTFTGTGQGAVTPKGRVFGLVSADGSNSTHGNAVIVGSASKDRKSFTVKITAAIPDRLGPPPAGFVISRITAKGKKK
jgi:hypothetical protein